MSVEKGHSHPLLAHSLFLVFARWGLRPNLGIENEFPSESIHKNDMVDLLNRRSSTTRTILYTILDIILWTGLSLLASQAARWRPYSLDIRSPSGYE